MGATIDVICYKSKVLANQEHPLMLRVTKDRKRKYLSLGISTKSEFWDFEKNEPKRNCPNKEEIQSIILERKREYQAQILEYKVANREFTSVTLVEKVRSPVKAKTVKAVFDLYIERLMEANRLRYAQMYKTTLNSLVKFNGHMDIHFSDIDVAWLKRYEAFMKGENLAMNTLETRFVRLRTIFNLAIEEKIVKAEYYPFKAFKVSKLKQKTAKRSIPKSGILEVLNYKGKTDYERLAIDLFSFSYLTAGINFVDIANLKAENIEDNRVVYFRKKTKKLIKVPLQPKALELIHRYSDSDNPYLFPILSPFHITEQQKANRIHKVISKVNENLKRIGKELDLSLSLTTYVARHSFATVLKRSGVSTSIISESLGHSSERVTQFYLDSFDNEQMNEAMKNLL